MKYLFNLTDMHIHPSSPNSSISEESAATKIQAGFRGYRVRKQLKKIIKSDGTIKRDANAKGHHRSSNNNQEEKSATKIQAGVRGFLVRKKQKLAADAAVKIQAGFRGFKARKDVKKLKGKK